ncbi:MAG: hypothetical protein Q9214_004022 [Letrouitia sp. 1 TL-2023]
MAAKPATPLNGTSVPYPIRHPIVLNKKRAIDFSLCLQTKPVFRQPLAVFSQSPMTGFYRDGYCRVGAEDRGNHAVAGVLTKEFLDFSASRGNNLRSIGLTPGCKWCLCTARWREAMEAAKGNDDPVVPRVFLNATDESALSNGVTMDSLQKYAAVAPGSEGGGAASRSE